MKHTTPTFTTYMQDVRVRTEPAVHALLAANEWAQQPHFKQSYRQFADSMFGGKMMRSALVYLGFQLAGGKKLQALSPVAAAFELLHAALLIHDDIMDNSEIRRGRPSLHVALGNDIPGRGIALCYGDLGLVMSIEAIAGVDFPAALKKHAMTFFTEQVKRTIAGQILDMQLAHSPVKKPADIFLIHSLKTAAYTVISPLCVGAILAGGKPRLLTKLQQFGLQLGIAFQLQDDLLGVFGQGDVMGKSAVSDIQEGKNTLLISHAQAHATAQQRAVLKRYYGTGRITQVQAQQVRKIFLATGAKAYCELQKEKHTKKAKVLIPEITSNTKIHRLLDQFVAAAVFRRK